MSKRYKMSRGKLVTRRGRLVFQKDTVRVQGKRYSTPTGRLPGGFSRVLVCTEGRKLKVVGHGGLKERLYRVR